MDHRNPAARFLLRLLLISACITGVSSGICFLDQMLTPEGECVDCPFCPGGHGMDLEEEVVSYFADIDSLISGTETVV